MLWFIYSLLCVSKGSPGMQGTPGPAGKPGLPGVTGATGKPGSTGQTGDRGPKGDIVSGQRSQNKVSFLKSKICLRLEIFS